MKLAIIIGFMAMLVVMGCSYTVTDDNSMDNIEDSSMDDSSIEDSSMDDSAVDDSSMDDSSIDDTPTDDASDSPSLDESAADLGIEADTEPIELGELI